MKKSIVVACVLLSTLVIGRLVQVILAQCPNGTPVAIYPQVFPPGSLSVTVEQGMREPFSAVVPGTNNQTVTWYVDSVQGGNSSTGTISATGIYTAPAANGTHTISATSPVQGINPGTATVTVSGTLPTYSCAWNKGTGAAGNSNCTMTHDGVTRNFFVHIPSGFSANNSSAIVGVPGNDVDEVNYCDQTGSGIESTGIALYSDAIPGAAPPMAICPRGIRAQLGGTKTGYAFHSYDFACTAYTNIGNVCPDDSDYIRQIILAADKDNQLNLKANMVEGTWTNGASMSLRAAVETGDLIASVGTLEGMWHNPAGDFSSTLDVIQGIYPVSVMSLGQANTSTAPKSMDFCGATSTSDPYTYTADDMNTYWNTTNKFTSFDTTSSLCNGFNSSGYGLTTGLFEKKGTGGTLNTEIQQWYLKAATNKMYCSEEGPGQVCTPIIHFESNCPNGSAVSPCNSAMAGATSGAMCTGAGGSCDTMNTLLENWRENHAKP